MYKIYGKPKCPNCDKLKAFMIERGTEFDYVDINNSEDLLLKLKSLGARSAPQVFKVSANGDETHIGGYKEAIEYITEWT